MLEVFNVHDYKHDSHFYVECGPRGMRIKVTQGSTTSYWSLEGEPKEMVLAAALAKEATSGSFPFRFQDNRQEGHFYVWDGPTVILEITMPSTQIQSRIEMSKEEIDSFYRVMFDYWAD